VAGRERKDGRREERAYHIDSRWEYEIVSDQPYPIFNEFGK
jgi:hypothetical protein